MSEDDERCPKCGAPGPLARTWGDANSAGSVVHSCDPYRFMPKRDHLAGDTVHKEAT